MSLWAEKDEEESYADELPGLAGSIMTLETTRKVVDFDASDDKFKRPFNSDNVAGTTPQEMNKILANASGNVRSKQYVRDGENSIYATVDCVEPHYNLDQLAKLYDIDPHHASAVDALVDNIVGLGYYYAYTRKTEKLRIKATKDGPDAKEKLEEKLEDKKEQLKGYISSFNQYNTFEQILERVAKDRFTMGNGYLEVGRTVDGQIGYIGHIPAQTVRIRRMRDGYVQYAGNRPIFFRNFGDKKTQSPFGGGTPNEIIHFAKYSPMDEYYGVPEIVSAVDAIAGNQYAMQYNLEYFLNKAVPRYIIKAKGVRLTLKDKQELLSVFETETKGTSHRTVIVPLPNNDRSDITFEPIEAGKQEASFGPFIAANISTILARHRVPANRLGITEGSSLAGSRDADKIFKESVCRPAQVLFEDLFNKVISEITNAFKFKLTEYTLTDEDQQSIIDERDMKNGALLPDERRVKLGLPPRPDGNGDEAIDLRSLQAMAEQNAQKLQSDSLKSSEKLARESNKAQVEAAKNAPKPAVSTAARPVAGRKPAATGKAAQPKAEAKAAGNRSRDSARSASRSNAAGAPASRNAKGSGRKVN